MMVMVLVLVLLGGGVSQMESVVAGVKLDLLVYQMQRLLQVARVQAVSRDEAVVVCASSDGVVCGGAWRDGVLVQTVAEPHDKIAFYKHHDARLFLDYRGFGAADKVIVRAEGSLKQQNGTFTLRYQSQQLQLTKKLIMNRSGRVRVTHLNQ